MRSSETRYFTSTFACVATSFQIAMSSLIKAMNCSGEFPTVCIACFSRSSSISGSLSAFRNSAFNLLMIAGGVFAGARTPCQATESKPG